MIVDVRVTDCYCELPKFYENVAKRLPNYSDSCKFDCSKIEVSETVADTLEDFFLTEKSGDRISFGMMWLNYGPKVNSDLKKFDVKVSDDFIQNE